VICAILNGNLEENYFDVDLRKLMAVVVNVTRN
jgi:hypothetical protein